MDRINSEREIKLSLRVLVADDLELIREMVKQILEARGYQVEVVENGQLLINKLLEENQSFDLVITDNNMPEKTGLQALQEIHSNERLNKLPVILMTSDDYGGALKKKLEDLNASFLAKPFSIEDLYSTINRLTQKPESIK